MKTFVLILMGLLIVIGSISIANATGLVNMSATVVERKSTDTINDFDLRRMTVYTPPPALKDIKGVSTVNIEAISCPQAPQVKMSFFVRIRQTLHLL